MSERELKERLIDIIMMMPDAEVNTVIEEWKKKVNTYYEESNE